MSERKKVKTARCTVCRGWGFIPDKNPMVICGCVKQDGKGPPPGADEPKRHGFAQG